MINELIDIFFLGESFVSLSAQFCTGLSTIRNIIKETCVAITLSLRVYSKTPNTTEEWRVCILKLSIHTFINCKIKL